MWEMEKSESHIETKKIKYKLSFLVFNTEY